MLQKLLLRPQFPMPEDGEPVFDWVLADINGDILKTGKAQALDAIDQTLMQNGLEHLSASCLWPAGACLSTLAQIPGKPSRVNTQMLAFAVEEQLGQDLEEVYIVQGPHVGDGRFVVRCVDRADFERVYDLLTQDGWSFQLKEIVLDADLLPQDQADLTAMLSGERVLMKHRATQKALATGRENLDLYLNLLLSELTGGGEERIAAEQALSVRFYVDADAAAQIDLVTAQLAQYPGVEVQTEANDWPELEFLTQLWLQRKSFPLNFCQGEYKLVAEDQGLWKKWRSVALVASLGFVLQLGVFIGKGYHYQQQAKELESLALAEYRKLVPDAGRLSVDRLPRIIKGKLNQAGSASAANLDFLSLLGETGNQYQRSPDKNNVQFKSLSYNEQRGELTIELLAQNFEQLDRLKQAIDGVGLSAKISSAVQEDKFFRGRISVSGS